MAGIPTVGGSDGTWGSELKDFLEVAHEANGTLKPNFSAYTLNDSDGNAMLKSHAYKAATDGFAMASVVANALGDAIRGYVGATNDPAGAGVLVQGNAAIGNSDIPSICFPVQKNAYFEITGYGTPTIRWMSVGTLSAPVDYN
jgi:hypothetical protein